MRFSLSPFRPGQPRWGLSFASHEQALSEAYRLACSGPFNTDLGPRVGLYQDLATRQFHVLSGVALQQHTLKPNLLIMQVYNQRQPVPAVTAKLPAPRP